MLVGGVMMIVYQYSNKNKDYLDKAVTKAMSVLYLHGVYESNFLIMFRYFKQIFILILLFLSFNISAAELIKDKDLVSAITDGNTKNFRMPLNILN